MYLIADGEVGYVEDGEVYFTRRQGDYFGDSDLLLAEERVSTVKALGPTDLFMLSKSDFLATLNKYPDVRNAVIVAALRRHREEDWHRIRGPRLDCALDRSRPPELA